MPSVSDHTGELDGLPVFWRSAPPPDSTSSSHRLGLPAGLKLRTYLGRRGDLG